MAVHVDAFLPVTDGTGYASDGPVQRWEVWAVLHSGRPAPVFYDTHAFQVILDPVAPVTGQDREGAYTRTDDPVLKALREAYRARLGQLGVRL